MSDSTTVSYTVVTDGGNFAFSNDLPCSPSPCTSEGKDSSMQAGIDEVRCVPAIDGRDCSNLMEIDTTANNDGSVGLVPNGTGPLGTTDQGKLSIAETL